MVEQPRNPQQEYPAVVLLDSHEDPAVYMLLAKCWPKFRQLGYIFTAEHNRELTLQEVIELHKGYLTISQKLQRGEFSPQVIAEHQQILSIIEASRRMRPHALEFLTQLSAEEYQAVESSSKENDLLENAGEGPRGILARDKLNACAFLTWLTVAKLGVGHLMSLQEYILSIAKKEFGLTKDQVANLVIFAYIHSDKPITARSRNALDGDNLEERIRAGKVRYPIDLVRFELTTPELLPSFAEKLFKIIDEKAARLKGSPLENFREKNKDKLRAITERTFHENSNIIERQCLREGKPKPSRNLGNIFDAKKSPGAVRRFSTTSVPAAMFPHRPLAPPSSPIGAVAKTVTSLLKRR